MLRSSCNLPKFTVIKCTSHLPFTNFYGITIKIDLLFDWFGISCMTTDSFCFYLQNRLIQTSQTLAQLYSDASPFSIPCIRLNCLIIEHRLRGTSHFFVKSFWYVAEPKSAKVTNVRFKSPKHLNQPFWNLKMTLKKQISFFVGNNKKQ